MKKYSDTAHIYSNAPNVYDKLLYDGINSNPSGPHNNQTFIDHQPNPKRSKVELPNLDTPDRTNLDDNFKNCKTAGRGGKKKIQQLLGST